MNNAGSRTGAQGKSFNDHCIWRGAADLARRVLPALLVLCMLMALVPVGALAQATNPAAPSTPDVSTPVSSVPDVVTPDSSAPDSSTPGSSTPGSSTPAGTDNGTSLDSSMPGTNNEASQGKKNQSPTGLSSPQTSGAPQTQGATLAGASVELSKTSTKTAVEVYGHIPYDFTVTNTGSVDLTNVKVTDPKLNLTQVVGKIKADESTSFSVNYPTTIDTEDPFVNIATVTADSPSGPVSASSNTCSVHVKKPKVDFEKTGPEYACPGDTVTYMFTATNVGEIKLTNASFIDTVLQPKEDQLGGVLLPTEHLTFTRTYTIPSDYTGKSLLNTATIIYNFREGKDFTVQDTDTWAINIPAIDIDKKVNGVDGPINLHVGDAEVYTYQVKNEGDCALSVTITDDKEANPIAGPFNLAAGATSATFTSSKTASNTAPTPPPPPVSMS